VGEVLEQAVRRMARNLERRGALEADDGTNGGDDDATQGQLEASAVSGLVPLHVEKKNQMLFDCGDMTIVQRRRIRA
jgi:hypothetical protein